MKTQKESQYEVVLAMGGAIETAIVPYHIARLRAANPELSIYTAVSDGAMQFITTTTLRGVTGNAVYSSERKFDSFGMPSHLSNSKRDLLVIYPATARILAEMSLGIISCPVTRLFAFTKKENIIITPYIHEDMCWELYSEHLEKLANIGCKIVAPKGRYWQEESAWVRTGQAIRGFFGLDQSVETQHLLRVSQ